MNPKLLKGVFITMSIMLFDYFVLYANILDDKKEPHVNSIEMGGWFTSRFQKIFLKPEYYFKSRKFLPYIGLNYYSYQYEINNFPPVTLGTNETQNIGIVFGIAKNVFHNDFLKIDLGLEENFFNTNVNVILNNSKTKAINFFSNSIFLSSRFNIYLSRKLLLGPRIDLGYGYGFIKRSDYNDSNLTDRSNGYFEIRYYLGIKYLFK